MTISSFLAAATPRPVGALHALVLAVACCAPALATAKTVTYSYQGANYALLSGGACLTSSMATSIKFTVAAALGANFSGIVTPISWAANDGKTKFTSKSANLTVGFKVGTDGNGNITSWQILLDTVSAKSKETSIFSVNEPHVGAYDLAQIPCGRSSSYAETQGAGSWSF